MKFIDIVIIVVIALIIGGAVAYIIKAKKSGKKCIGCSDCACSDAKKKGGCQGACGSCNCCYGEEDNSAD